MLVQFAGPPALSPFRRDALLARCRALLPQLSGLETRHLYLAHLSRPLQGAEAERLGQVLGAEAAGSAPGEVLICPRPGTISPWSSKATEILRRCGLEAVARVERGTAYRFAAGAPLSVEDLQSMLPLLHDRMTEAVVHDPEQLFRQVEPLPLVHLPLRREGRGAIEEANTEMGLALSPEEIEYFVRAFAGLDRDPTDVELMMFSVVNSEHCRHKIFNAAWQIEGQTQELSLFAMIRHTHARNPQGCVVAYADNSGVIQGFEVEVFRPWEPDHHYAFRRRQTHPLIKVETHNHPTAISPYPGASTGVGGEIRDEGATGVGGQFQAGLCAFFTSHLRLPGWQQPWEKAWAAHPLRLATPLEIMLQGPIGGAAFGNEFGRPNILGVFRTFEQQVEGRHRGYHKPIMVAGGAGLIDEEHVDKHQPQEGDYVVQLGGPSMLIGLGGGAASSMDTGTNLEDLDFASVQRDNPEMQRRCQELINRCVAQGVDNPILSIHDVGAGGLSNACPELVQEVGARFDLRAIPNDDPGMSPMQIWCNEAQERYVLVIRRDSLERFGALARRERCLFAVIGEITGDRTLTLHDPRTDTYPIDHLDLQVILGKPPRMVRRVQRRASALPVLELDGIALDEAVHRVLSFPAVASKTFLITIADRTVTGLVARDQLAGPYQTPIADVAATAHSFTGYTGSAMAMGERAPLALLDAPASGRMAIAEAIANIAAAPIGEIGNIKLSANWMCACGEEGEDALLYDTVQAVGMEFCPELGVAIPVGKDSLSMRTVWEDSSGKHKVVSPLSLVISAFAPVPDIRRILTPDLKTEADTRLLLVDLGFGRQRLGGSALAQVHDQIGNECPDVEPAALRSLYAAIQELNPLLLAYHDRSDGGLLACVAEMAFGSRTGVEVDITALGEDALAPLFAEEIGAVVQYRATDEDRVLAALADHGLAGCSHRLGQPTSTGRLEIRHRGRVIFGESICALLQTWSALSYRMQSLRDNPDCAREEFESLADITDPGLSFKVDYRVEAPAITGKRPRMAILREQGVNGQVEMAAAFDAAGFEAVDLSMTDLAEGRAQLREFEGLVACGGFSYGDVLGAGAGWARSILFDVRMRDQFAAFFARPETFSLGVCNGCQMLSLLKELIPGAGHWPRFRRNRSEQFEARLVTVEVLPSPSVLLAGMEGSRLGIACAHGEGRAEFASPADQQQAQGCLRYVDNQSRATERYPFNPNGSLGGLTGLTTPDGRATILMPHPERVFRNVQLSWRPPDWTGEYSPWLRLFQNARRFAAQS
ncbi:MAG: phosphoribosylformylglycinamidine synthase [Candidatus Handelsmanbacteria bacterium]|nr:phosphoribosylformylglycinamidine synthase [Candidatus Handelsmanbacteria bacterium]